MTAQGNDAGRPDRQRSRRFPAAFPPSVQAGIRAREILTRRLPMRDLRTVAGNPRAGTSRRAHARLPLRGQHRSFTCFPFDPLREIARGHPVPSAGGHRLRIACPPHGLDCRRGSTSAQCGLCEATRPESAAGGVFFTPRQRLKLCACADVGGMHYCLPPRARLRAPTACGLGAKQHSKMTVSS